jgi:quercetin dioxygenase-like cupin family protein
VDHTLDITAHGQYKIDLPAGLAYHVIETEEKMIIKKLTDAPVMPMPDHGDISKQIVLGPNDGSKEIVLRYFKVPVGGSSPYHHHGFPHLVKVESGEGAAVDPEGNEHPIGAGDYVYVNDNETHCFKNTGRESLEFICIVPARGEG